MFTFAFFVLLTIAVSVIPSVECSTQELRYGYPIYNGTCDAECKPEEGCRGPGPRACFSCRHYYNKNSGKCVKACYTKFVLYEDCLACHEECIEGCQGLSAAGCHKCKNFFDVDTGECVKTCDKKTLHYLKKNERCGKCHEECVGGCYGRDDYECYGCRNKKSGDNCVRECRDDEYVKKYDGVESNECVKCHEHCLWKCSGSNNTEGAGGCTACPKLVMNPLLYQVEAGWWIQHTDKDYAYCVNRTCYKLDRCIALDDTCPDRLYDGIVPLGSMIGKFALMSGKRACLPCHHYCSKCTKYGFNSTVCQKCPKHPDCSCPSGKYFDNNRYQECRPCKEECKECTNLESCSECGNDHKYRVYDEGYPSANGSFTCMKKCPPLQRFSNFSDLYQNYCVSSEEINLKPQENESKGDSIDMTVLVTASVIVLAVLVFGIFVYLQTRKTSNTVNFGMDHNQTLEDPEEPLIPSNIAPNRNKLRIIAESDVIKTEVLGNGAFGVVYRGFLLREGCNARDPVAIKVLNPENTETSTRELLKEATIMGRVDHVNLLPLLAICVTSNVMLVTKLMPLGDLLHYLRKHDKRIMPKTMVNWCLQIAEGMDYLEKLSLVHRDLAARNVLMQTVSRIKVTDFGLAQAINIDRGIYESSGGKLPVKWCALESLKRGIFTHKTDVWSFGVTVWEILTYGEEPYESCTTLPMLLATLEGGRRLGQPDSCSSDLYTVLVTCWAEDATSRPSFQELVDTFSMMLRDPGRFIIELRGDGNQTAPEPLPRNCYENMNEAQLEACRYENTCMETIGTPMDNLCSDSVVPAEYVNVMPNICTVEIYSSSEQPDK